MDKIYAGNGRLKKFDWGEMTSMVFFKDDLERMLDNLNDKGCVTLDIKERKQESAKGFTLYGQVFIQSERTEQPKENAADGDDLPW